MSRLTIDSPLSRQALLELFFHYIGQILMYGSLFLPIGLCFMVGSRDHMIYGSMAWIALLIIMVIRPLVDIFPRVILFQKILSIRRSIGIFMGMSALTHGIGYFKIFPSLVATNMSWILDPHRMFLYGIIGLIFSTLLLLTSNTLSVQILGPKWKWLHKSVYIIFYAVCIHIYLIEKEIAPLVLGAIVGILRIWGWRVKSGKAHISENIPTGEQYQCTTCSWVYDESKGDPDGGIAPGTKWEDIPDTWKCPVCGVSKHEFTHIVRKTQETPAGSSYLAPYEKPSSDVEPDFRSIFEKAVTGKEEISAMGTKKNYRNLFEDIMFLPAQLAHRVYDEHEVSVNLNTVIGPKAKHPITLKLPFYVSHMSFGSLSREAKVALAKGSKVVGTMICGGEGGLLDEEFQNAGVYVYEYSTGRFGATEENMKKAHAIEIKIGQAAKAGLGGHLLGPKVTEEIAKVRGVEPWKDVISPANHPDIKTKEDMKDRVTYLRNLSGGKPIGIKIVASHIENDLEVAVFCEPDFITIDCRGGATGAAPIHIKDNVCIPAPYAIYRARKYLDSKGVGRDITLLVTGGFRTSADVAKAIALGADGVGLATVAMIGIGCQQYRVCHKGTCPVGIATQNPDLRKRFDMYKSAEMLVRLFNVYKRELEDFVRILAKKDIHTLDSSDLVTISSEISEHTDVKHA